MTDRRCATCLYWRERTNTPSVRLGKIGECAAAPPIELAGERSYPLTSERSNCDSWEAIPRTPKRIPPRPRSRIAGPDAGPKTTKGG